SCSTCSILSRIASPVALSWSLRERGEGFLQYPQPDRFPCRCAILRCAWCARHSLAVSSAGSLPLSPAGHRDLPRDARYLAVSSAGSLPLSRGLYVAFATPVLRSCSILSRIA